MLLSQLSGGAPPIEVSSLAYDSRTVAPGALFFCVSGLRTDGHGHAGAAIERGAVALVVERPLGLGVPEIVVADVRVAMAELAVRFYDDPSAATRKAVVVLPLVPVTPATRSSALGSS